MFLIKVALGLTIVLLALFQQECTHTRPTLPCQERSFVISPGSCLAFDNPCEELRWEAGDTFEFGSIDPDRRLNLTVMTEGLPADPTRQFCVSPGSPPSTGLVRYIYQRERLWGEGVFDITVSGTAPPGADVEVTVSDSADPVPTTGPLTYTFVVTNNGPLTASGVILSYPLPLQTEVSGNFFPSQGTCSLSLTNVLTCNFGTLASGNSATLPLPLFSLPPGTMTSTATVLANENDTNSSNNTDTETTTVTP